MTTYSWDFLDRMTRQSTAAGDVVAEYGSRSFLTRVTYPSGRGFSFTYDALGRRTSRTSDDGFVLDYERDGIGRLVRVTNGAGTAYVTYRYDVNGRLSREDRGNGTATTYTYDASGRVLSMTHLSPGGAAQTSFAYRYDAVGNPNQVITPAGVTIYAYDAASRLVGVTWPDGHQTTISYDAAGNRTEVVDGATTSHYTANNLNQVTRAGSADYLYDADGNLVARSDGTGTRTYSYDAEGQLVRVVDPVLGTFEFEYDVLARRVTERRGSSVTRFVWDGAAPAAEYAGSGNLVARYVVGAGLVARIAADGSATYFGFDAAGNTRLVTNAAGNVANSYDYTPWGVPVSISETVPNPFRFGGRFGVRTDAYDLVQMGARAYDPALGRFISIDPIRYDAGVNLYEYAGNNPVRWVDPSGLMKVDGLSGTSKGTTIVNALLGLGQSTGLVVATFASGLAGTGVSVISTGVGIYNGDAIATGTSLCDTFWNGVSSLLGIVNFGIQHSAALEADKVAFASASTMATVGSLAILIAETDVEIHNDLMEAKIQNMAGQENRVPLNPYGYYNEVFQGQPPAAALEELKKEFLPRYRWWGLFDIIVPGDPNGKLSNTGAGPRHLVKAGTPLTFTVQFQNVPTASAPAQEVFVTDPLDPNLDWSTLCLTEVGWGTTTIPLAECDTTLSRRASVPDYRTGDFRSWWVDVAAELTGSGSLKWTFRTLDPATNDLPTDPLAGFLPADDATGRGEGYVSFSVRSREGLSTGTQLLNTAAIVFDQNGAMSTNQTVNTIGTPGDANDDRSVDPGDVFYLVNYFFGGGPAPAGLADCNGDGTTDVLDIFHLINHLYAGGPAPVD